MGSIQVTAGMKAVSNDPNAIDITLRVTNLNGVSSILQAFNAIQNTMNGAFVEGALGWVNVITRIYACIKRGKAN